MQILLIVAGLALIFMTEFDVFGWILLGLGAVLIALPLLLMGAVFRKVNRFDRW